MKQVIIYSNEKGNVSICIPTGEIPIEEVQIKNIPIGVISYIVDRSTLPFDDFDFFDAWEQSNGKVSINIEKAKELTKQKLREMRQPLLMTQDIAFQRALESGADTTAIVAEKNRLRDITKLPENCTTLDELRAIKI